MTPTVARLRRRSSTLDRRRRRRDRALARRRPRATRRPRRRCCAADDPPEPPYWAHLWTGALRPRRRGAADAGRVLELGCGLGLPGVVAARRGARVTFVDRLAAPLAFVRASAAANRLAPVGLCVADFAGAALRGPVDLVLAAEVLYDRATLGALPDALAAACGPAAAPS